MKPETIGALILASVVGYFAFRPKKNSRPRAPRMATDFKYERGEDFSWSQALDASARSLAQGILQDAARAGEPYTLDTCTATRDDPQIVDIVRKALLRMFRDDAWQTRYEWPPSAGATSQVTRTWAAATTAVLEGVRTSGLCR